MKDQTEGKSHRLKTKTDTCGQKINPEGKSPFETKRDACGRTTKAEGQISLFKQKRVSVDVRSNSRGKSPFSNKNGYLWTGPKLYLSTNSFITTQFTQWFRYC